jgi:hypothetical protein
VAYPEERLLARLAADAPVLALVGDAIRPMILAADDALPNIVYQRVATEFYNDSTGGATTAQATINVTCSASSYSGAKALANAVRVAMNGWNDASSGVWHLETEADDAESIVSGEDTYIAFQCVQTYLVGFALS